MENVIGVAIPRKQFDLEEFEIDESAINCPVLVGGKAIGFISGVTADYIIVYIWTESMSIMCNDDGRFLHIDLDANRGFTA